MYNEKSSLKYIYIKQLQLKRWKSSKSHILIASNQSIITLLKVKYSKNYFLIIIIISLLFFTGQKNGWRFTNKRSFPFSRFLLHLFRHLDGYAYVSQEWKCLVNMRVFAHIARIDKKLYLFPFRPALKDCWWNTSRLCKWNQKFKTL